MNTDWKYLALALAEELGKCEINYTRGQLLRRVREAAGLIDGEEADLILLNLPKQIYNPLRRGGYDTIEQVEAAGAERLMLVGGLGPDRVGLALAAVRKWRQAK